MNAIGVSLYTQRKYGRTLCSECAKKAKELDYKETTDTTTEIEDVLN